MNKNILIPLISLIPDKIYLKIIYRVETGQSLHLHNPQTFNEKMQWLKLNNRNPKFSEMVDKVAVRDIIKTEIGEQYLVPILGVWDNADKIDFNTLPDQFVLKCTHDSGDLIICKDKSKLNIEEARAKLNKGLKTSLYAKGREWPYKNVKPRVYGEVYMSDEDSDQLTDYKFYCFNGIPKLIQVDYDRFTDHKRQFYSPSWELTNISWHLPSDTTKMLKRPVVLEEMLKISAKLSKEIPFLRVDFYVVGTKLYIGETTFFPGAGFGKWMPEGTDEMLGQWLSLNLDKGER